MMIPIQHWCKSVFTHEATTEFLLSFSGYETTNMVCPNLKPLYGYENVIVHRLHHRGFLMAHQK